MSLRHEPIRLYKSFLAIAAVLSLLSSNASGEARPAAQATPIGLTIHDYGFEQRELHAPSGRLLLAVHNRSSLPDVAVRIDRLTGGRLQAFRSGRRALRRFLELPPGIYVITEEHVPSWRCRLEISAR